MPAAYEEQVTAFVDFLGFSEASTGGLEEIRTKLLELLISISHLRGEFDVRSTPMPGGSTLTIKPAVSTFSDHIVISFPLEPTRQTTGLSEEVAGLVIMGQLEALLGRIAAAALRIGFLVRGGITVGKLYHSAGVVFGEAMVEAYLLESQIAVYPRVVLSTRIVNRPQWLKDTIGMARDHDGLFYLDYFKGLLFRSSVPGETFLENAKAWFDDVIKVISTKLAELEQAGKLKELSKWTWFARKFRAGLGHTHPEIMKGLNLSMDQIPWSDKDQ
jgi:hypothetical protein